MGVSSNNIYACLRHTKNLPVNLSPLTKEASTI